MAGSTNWWLLVLFVILPVGLGLALILAASCLRSQWTRAIARIAGTVILLFALFVTFEGATYLWALHLESKWAPAEPKSRAELEGFLSPYSQRVIEPPQSGWGSDHELRSGERMVQYRLLYRAPLDVVYTTNDAIVAIYTSYE
jgi:hypothetical protein